MFRACYPLKSVRFYCPLTVKSLYEQVHHARHGPISIDGWIKSIRLLKRIAFLDLQDGTSVNPLRIVVPLISNDDVQFLKNLKTGQTLSISNAIWQDTNNREQPFELQIKNPAESIKLIGPVSENYPLQKKFQTLPYLRSLPTLKYRTSYLSAILRLRSFVESQFMLYFQANHFTKVSPPILTSNDCEGAGELFQVSTNQALNSSSYFGKPTYLTVSTQLHLEILSLSLSRCWTLSPCFRAEKSDTPRHLSEFWMLEVEMCFINSIHELTSFVEATIKQIISACVDNQSELLPKQFVSLQEDDTSSTLSVDQEKQQIERRWQNLVNKKWQTIAYTQAIDILKKHHNEVRHFKYEPTWGQPLQTEHEKFLAGEYFKSPVFVTDYPRACKAFYMKQNSTPDDTVACFDLLVPEMGEIVGGSLREDNYDKLCKEMKERGMNKSGELDWYVSLRKEGGAPHGGFGLGFERFVSYLYGNHNIRDAIPFHRTSAGTIDF
ncbi:YCR024C [Saccharomyces arboricola H-6]|uniref:Asparagine--tRNA ligase, mitochondrial n=1 Tax=Saccharomyces arboricola (strain H-6 / AS 2.3317 / CBS 10644) TaxID=1160507 RepID=J8Q7A7_SACAR|nr:YCR024C [Saccharomyces arboricola H-6]